MVRSVNFVGLKNNYLHPSIFKEGEERGGEGKRGEGRRERKTGRGKRGRAGLEE